MTRETTEQNEDHVQRDTRERGRIDGMQRSLTRLHADIAVQRQALQEGRRNLTERQGDVAEQDYDLAVSERFEEDLQQNIDDAQHRLERPHSHGEEPIVPS